jgi:hypothetical protein
VLELQLPPAEHRQAQQIRAHTTVTRKDNWPTCLIQRQAMSAAVAEAQLAGLVAAELPREKALEQE